MDAQKIAEVVGNVNAGLYSERQLTALYENAKGLNAKGLRVVEVLEAIERQMRRDFPNAANRMFGARDDEARAMLAKVWEDVSPLVSLQANRVGNGVKTGGGRISGDRHIDVYISYKTTEMVGAFLALEQESADTELTAKVGRYRTGRNKFREEKEFPMSEFGAAAEEFKRLVIELSSSAKTSG